MRKEVKKQIYNFYFPFEAQFRHLSFQGVREQCLKCKEQFPKDNILKNRLRSIRAQSILYKNYKNVGFLYLSTPLSMRFPISMSKVNSVKALCVGPAFFLHDFVIGGFHICKLVSYIIFKFEFYASIIFFRGIYIYKPNFQY